MMNANKYRSTYCIVRTALYVRVCIRVKCRQSLEIDTASSKFNDQNRRKYNGAIGNRYNFRRSFWKFVKYAEYAKILNDLTALYVIQMECRTIIG